MNWLVYLAAIAAGAANPGQSGANAQLRKSLDETVLTAAWVYLSGLLAMLLIQVFVREAWPAGSKLAQVPWWAWLGGLLSIGSTVTGITLAHRLGSGVFTGVSVTASLVTSVIIDNYGWIGFKVHPLSVPRVAGCILMVAGLWLIGRF